LNQVHSVSAKNWQGTKKLMGAERAAWAFHLIGLRRVVASETLAGNFSGSSARRSSSLG